MNTIAVHPADPGQASIRKRGLWKMGIGLLVAAAWFAIVYYCTANTTWRFYGPALGLPAAPFVIGCVEFATGRTFQDLSRRWDALTPSQRGALGLASSWPPSSASRSSWASSRCPSRHGAPTCNAPRLHDAARA